MLASVDILLIFWWLWLSSSSFYINPRDDPSVPLVQMKYVKTEILRTFQLLTLIFNNLTLRGAERDDNARCNRKKDVVKMISPISDSTQNLEMFNSTPAKMKTFTKWNSSQCCSIYGVLRPKHHRCLPRVPSFEMQKVELLVVSRGGDCG